MTGRFFLKLQELPFDGPHARHHAIEFGQKKLLILLRPLGEIGAGTVADPVECVGQLPVQKPHALLQIEKFLVQLAFPDHVMDLAEERVMWAPD